MTTGLNKSGAIFMASMFALGVGGCVLGCHAPVWMRVVRPAHHTSEQGDAQMTTADPMPTEALATIRGALEHLKRMALNPMKSWDAGDTVVASRVEEEAEDALAALPVLERALAASPPRVGLRPAREVARAFVNGFWGMVEKVPGGRGETLVERLTAAIEADRQGAGPISPPEPCMACKGTRGQYLEVSAVSPPHFVPCQYCRGTGYSQKSPPEPSTVACEHCKGTGSVYLGEGLTASFGQCGTCRGTGRHTDKGTR